MLVLPQPLGGSEFGLPRSHKITNLLGYRKSRLTKKEAQKNDMPCRGEPVARPLML